MSKLPPTRHDRRRELSRKVWPEVDVVPNIGEHVDRYCALSGDRSNAVQDSHDAMVRGQVMVALSSALAEYMEEYGGGSALEVTVPLLLRLVHTALAVLGQQGIHGDRLNALLARYLEDELSKVDPERGLLDGNDGTPYRSLGLVVDPPGFASRLKNGAIRELNKILTEDSKNTVDYVDEP